MFFKYKVFLWFSLLMMNVWLQLFFQIKPFMSKAQKGSKYNAWYFCLSYLLLKIDKELCVYNID